MAATWSTPRGFWAGRSRCPRPAARTLRARYCWFIAVDFADGSLGHLDLQIPVRGDFQEGFQVQGEHGSVTGRVHLPWFHKSSDVECFSARDRQFHRVLGEDAHTYKRQIEAFAATILDGVPSAGRQPRRRPGGRAGDGRDRPLGRSGELVRLDDVREVCDAAGDLCQDISAADARGDARRGRAHGLTHVQFNMSCVGLPTLPDESMKDLCVGSPGRSRSAG